jgi:hypothetical protein
MVMATISSTSDMPRWRCIKREALWIFFMAGVAAS